MGPRSLFLTGPLPFTACGGCRFGLRSRYDDSFLEDGPASAHTTTTDVAPTTTTTRPDEIPAADEIIADREVTPLERELARWAVFTCV